MSRSFAGSGDHLDASSGPYTAPPATHFMWTNTSANAQAMQYLMVTDGTLNNRFTLGTNTANANGNVSALITKGGVGQSQATTTAIPATGAWDLSVGSFAPYPNSTTAYEGGGNKGTGSGTTNLPTSLGHVQIGGRGGATVQKAHGAFFSRQLADIEIAAAKAVFLNPRQLPNCTDYWYINTASGTETDLVGSINLAITGTSAGSSQPNLAVFTNGTIANQSWTQGSAITSVDLTTKFDNGLASAEAWASSLKQIGSAGVTTTASGSASSATNVLVVASASGISAGDYITVGSSALTLVLYVSGTSLVLRTQRTWNNGDTVTRYPVNALTAVTSNGVTISGANLLSGTPLAGAVGTYNNCLVRANNTTNTGAIEDSNLFNIAVASSAAAPSFTAGPTLTSANTDGYTYGATCNQTATWHLGVYLKGSTTPSIANVEAGAGTGFVAHFTQALTAATPGTLSATGLSFPFHDVYQVVHNANGDSALVSNLAVMKLPPAGKQYQTLTIPQVSAITQANPAKVTATAHGFATGNWVEIFGVVGMTQINGNFGTVTVVDANNFTFDGLNSSAFTAYTSGGDVTWGQSAVYNASTRVVTGDVLVCDATDGQGNRLTASAYGTVSVATNSVARQSFIADVYSVSLGNFIGSVTDYLNDAAPSPPGQGSPLPALFFPANQTTSQNVGALATDPQGDSPLTVTAITSLPAGATLVSPNQTYTPPSQGLITPVTYQWANLSGEFVQASVNLVSTPIRVPNGVGLIQKSAQAQAQANYFQASFGTQDDPNPAGPAPSGVVINQSPPGDGTAFAAQGTIIAFTLSSGKAPPVTPTQQAQVNVLSGQLKNLQQVPATLNLSYLSGANSFDCADVCTAGAADAAGSAYHYFRIPSNARVVDIAIINDANPSGSAYSAGVYKQNGLLPATGAASIFCPPVSMDTARTTWTSIYQPSISGGSYVTSNRSLRVWELLGLAGDPNVLYDLCLTAVVPGQTGGLMCVRLVYVQ